MSPDGSFHSLSRPSRFQMLLPRWCFLYLKMKTVLSVPYCFSLTASVNPQISSVSASACASRSYPRFFRVNVYPLFMHFQHFFTFFYNCCYSMPLVGRARLLHFLRIPRRQRHRFPSITPAQGLRALRTSWKAY